MSNKRIPIIVGKKYGFLTVLSFSEKNKIGLIQWLCQCICGKKRIVTSRDLYNGIVLSCGCKINRKKYVNQTIPAKKFLYCDYKNGKKAKSLGFTISEEDFYKLTQLNCFYCDSPPTTIKKYGKDNYVGYYTYNGLDRVNNIKGYTLDNVVPCCKWCNFTKKNMTQKDFISWIKKFIKNISESENPVIKETYNKIKSTN